MESVFHLILIIKIFRINNYFIINCLYPSSLGCAPSLSCVQCGIAIDDATDAAKNAAAIILCSPGLAPLYR